MPFNLFASPPPAAPPPKAAPPLLVLSLGGLGVVLVVCFAALYYYVSRRWRLWIAVALDKAFAKTDLDKSGKINADELYIGVCEAYLALHVYGLNVKAPTRANVLRIMSVLDTDKSGEIDKDEFKELVTRLLVGQSSRIFTQLGLTVLCPITAGYVCAVLRSWVVFGLASLPIQLPPMPPIVDNIPSTMDETIVTGLMMLSIPPALALIDRLTEKEAMEHVSAKKSN